MKINERLQFSWGHIFAFVALILISYFSFMGLSYLLGGNFVVVGIIVAVILVVLFALFVGMQLLKATDHKFKKRIPLERALVFLSPVVLAALLFPMSHFWGIYDKRTAIETDFANTITSTKQLFTQYETYSRERISEMDTLICTNGGSITHMNNVHEALELQLLGDNYKRLKQTAYEWIGKASNATVWNVFTIGNIHTITDAFTSWNEILVGLSDVQLTEEEELIAFDDNKQNIPTLSKGFEAIKNTYTKLAFPSWYVWLIALGLYLFLLLPYIIQQRHTKNTHHLFYTEKYEAGTTFEIEDKQTNKKAEDDYGTFTL